MKRRSFLGFLPAALVLPVAAKALPEREFVVKRSGMRQLTKAEYDCIKDTQWFKDMNERVYAIRQAEISRLRVENIKRTLREIRRG